MRNRGKCKLCGDIIESFHRHDYVHCKCGEVAIEGGQDYLRVAANNFENFLRVDDEGNEVVVKVVEKEDVDIKQEVNDWAQKKITKKDLVAEFHAMVKKIEELPEQALALPVSHYDLFNFMALIAVIFKKEEEI